MLSNEFACSKKTKTKKLKSIWDKISNTTEKEFDENAADKGKFIKARRKSFNGTVISAFHYNKQKEKAPKMGSCRLCLPKIVLDFVLRMKNNDANYKYFQQIYLEQCKFEEMKTREREAKSSKKKMVMPKIEIKVIKVKIDEFV